MTAPVAPDCLHLVRVAPSELPTKAAWLRRAQSRTTVVLWCYENRIAFATGADHWARSFGRLQPDGSLLVAHARFNGPIRYVLMARA